MYSEKDFELINAKIRKNVIVLSVVIAFLAAGLVAALLIGIEWLATVLGPTIFVAVTFGLTAYVIPNAAYRRFLKDMKEGLSREMCGEVIEISADEEIQDGARVRHVRIRLADEDDERFVYLNVSKENLFAHVGDKVRMQCYGRHIMSWTEM